MAVWVVRAGRRGEREDIALRESCVLVGFHELGDLTPIESKDELRHRLEDALPDRSRNAIASYVGQVWAFKERIAFDDLVALPLKTTAAIAFGRVTGPYEYKIEAPDDARHRRPVEWLREDVARTAFDQDLLNSLGGASTVFQVQRHQAEARIRAVLDGDVTPPAEPSGGEAELDEPTVDLAERGRDQIRFLITRRFAGHALAGLVDALLQAEGYHTDLSPEGPDRGVDILAGGGPMGFDSPRIVVQVKTGSVDSPMVRDLQGTMENFGADQGLIVAWDGFRRGVEDEARRRFFRIRLLDSDRLIDRVTAAYDRLPAEIREGLPLTQIWTVAGEEGANG